VLWLLHDELHWSATSIIAALGLFTIVATIYIVSLLPREIVRLLLFGLSRIFFRLRIVGAANLPATGGALLVANHVSYADALLIGSCTHRFIHFLIWKPYFELKFAKRFFTTLQAIPIHPGSPKEMLKSLRSASDELKKGELVCIFPEGGLTRTGHLQAYQRGVERVIEYSPETAVIPIYLDGLWGHPLTANGRRNLSNWIRAWRCEVRILIGAPLSGPITAFELRKRVLELQSTQNPLESTAEARRLAQEA
jgi:acyl-[acyl-carrier-protein]-phospholipid O-acyltransferase/long-chain-fatty-acid--[acyl-carrier-protein] ligase